MADGTQAIQALVTSNLPRELLLAVEDALTAGAARAYAAAVGMDDGHLPHVLGQLRHFHMNEAFHRALASVGASPTAIQGNALVVGRCGIFGLGRFNTPLGVWNLGRRSTIRRQMSQANSVIERLVHPDIFSPSVVPTEAAAFFVSVFSGSPRVSPDVPQAIYLTVPTKDMRGFVYRENLRVLLDQVDQPSSQVDRAKPQLKGKQTKKDGTEGA